MELSHDSQLCYRKPMLGNEQDKIDGYGAEFTERLWLYCQSVMRPPSLRQCWHWLVAVGLHQNPTWGHRHLECRYCLPAAVTGSAEADLATCQCSPTAAPRVTTTTNLNTSQIHNFIALFNSNDCHKLFKSRKLVYVRQLIFFLDVYCI